MFSRREAGGVNPRILRCVPFELHKKTRWSTRNVRFVDLWQVVKSGCPWFVWSEILFCVFRDLTIGRHFEDKVSYFVSEVLCWVMVKLVVVP